MKRDSKTLFNGARVPRLPRILTQKCRSERLLYGRWKRLSAATTVCPSRRTPAGGKLKKFLIPLSNGGHQ